LVADEARLYVINGNTQGKITDFLRDVFELPRVDADQEQALREAEAGIAEVIAHREAITLEPQSAYVRRLQHELVEAYGLESESTGRDPQRRVVIRPASN
jgi:hypothetical protein